MKFYVPSAIPVSGTGMYDNTLLLPKSTGMYTHHGMMIMLDSSNKKEHAPKKNGDERNAVPPRDALESHGRCESTAFVTKRL
jgi:hypothetical protein